jgi:hypothetical protein
MTEEPGGGAPETTDGPETGEPRTGGSDPVHTGVPGVDAVIAAVAGLEERPIEEHVGVFEMAHEQLRRALDDRPAGRPAGDHPDVP